MRDEVWRWEACCERNGRIRVEEDKIGREERESKEDKIGREEREHRGMRGKMEDVVPGKRKK